MSDDNNKKHDRTIHLYEDVSISSIKKIAEKIVSINNEDDEEASNLKEYERKPIKLYISTNGGELMDCLGLISLIRSSKTPVHGYVSGYAFSAGFFIFISCHKRFIGQYANVMYHQLSCGFWGTLTAHKDNLEINNELMKILHNIVLEYTLIELEDLVKHDTTHKDWYFNSEKAIEYGVADKLF